MSTTRARRTAIALALSCGILFLVVRQLVLEASLHAASVAVWSIEPLTDDRIDPSEAVPIEVGEQDGPLLLSVPFATRQSRAETTEKSPLPRRGLWVSIATVRSAIESRAIPSGRSVAATGKHPGGVMFTSAAGPFRPGDILLSVGGTRATSESAVVRAALGAVKSGASALGGEIHRDGVNLPFMIMVPPEAKELWSSMKSAPRHKKSDKKQKKTPAEQASKTRAQRAHD